MTKKLASLALAAFCALSAPAAVINATSADIGKVIGANGNVYATVADATSAGTTAYAMIAYVNTEEAFGLAIAINDVGDGYMWDDAMSAAATWAAERPMDFGTWRLPTVDDFKHMFQSCGGSEDSSDSTKYRYGNFRSKLTACGASDVSLAQYWTSTENSGSQAYAYNFWSCYLGYFLKWNFRYIARCCLEFDITSDTAGRTGDCRWRFFPDSGTLRIWGSGETDDYYTYGTPRPPWRDRYEAAISNVVVEDGVTTIGNAAFSYCTNLTSSVIAPSVTVIGKEAFYFCKKLTEAELPSGLTSIGESAFGYCESLRCSAVPDGVKEIPYWGFRNCSAITNFTIHAGVTNIGRAAFWACPNLTDIHCHPNAAGLEWDTDGNGGFLPAYTTLVHVRGGQLAAYQAKFGGRVGATFVGDIPYESYDEWAADYGFKTSADVFRPALRDKITEHKLTVVHVDEQNNTGLAIGFQEDLQSEYDTRPWSRLSDVLEAYEYFYPVDFGTWRVLSLKELTTAPLNRSLRRILPSLNYSGVEYFWTSTEADDDNAYVYSTGFGTGESHAKSDRAIHVIPFLEFSFEPAAWEDGDLGDGVANVFRYAFDKPGDFGATSMLDIGFGADDMAVVKTPPVVNSAGFTYQVLASDNPAFDASGNVTAYDRDPSGATVIPETGKTARFFRLRAVEQ